MSTKISLTYCGMDGEGRTVKEAKQDAARKLESLMGGEWNPHFVYGRTHIGFVYRNIHGWCYKIFDKDEPIGTSGPVYGNSGYEDWREIDQQMRVHMAQNELDLDSPQPYEPPCYLKDRNNRQEYVRRVAWMFAWRQAIADGLKDRDAHDWARFHSDQFMPGNF